MFDLCHLWGGKKHTFLHISTHFYLFLHMCLSIKKLVIFVSFQNLMLLCVVMHFSVHKLLIQDLLWCPDFCVNSVEF